MKQCQLLIADRFIPIFSEYAEFYEYNTFKLFL